VVVVVDSAAHCWNLTLVVVVAAAAVAAALLVVNPTKLVAGEFSKADCYSQTVIWDDW
jgi:hypothetical protein